MSKTVRVIKKYPNRRLYDTANSGYITLADVKQMALLGAVCPHAGETIRLQFEAHR